MLLGELRLRVLQLLLLGARAAQCVQRSLGRGNASAAETGELLDDAAAAELLQPALDELAEWREGPEIGEGEAGALLEEVEMRILVELAKAGR